MFGYGRRNRGGLLGSVLGGLIGGRRYQTYPRRRGLLGNPLAQMALVAGASWLGNRVLQGRGQNLGGGFGGYNGQPDSGSASDNWGSFDQPNDNRSW